MKNEPQKINLYQLGEKIGGIDSKLDSIKEQLTEIVDTIKVHGFRLTDLELYKARIKGEATVWGIVGGGTISAIWAYLKSHNII